MPSSRRRCLRTGLLLNERASLALTLLARDILARANRVLGYERFRVELVTSAGSGTLSVQGVTVRTRRAQGRFDYLIVPPFERFSSDCESEPGDVALILSQHLLGATVASACLGALSLAAAGVLDGREATTHWAWGERARLRFPRVRWSLNRMICDLQDVITAGGYLAMVDLVLYIVARQASPDVAHELGRTLLADSVRQKQSVYAQRLIDPAAEDTRFSGLTSWIDAHLDRPIEAAEMARRCHMSLRSFHRSFAAAYRMTPRKFLQLKRLERARSLLREGSASIDRVVQAVGVSDISSFRRLFQREFGLSPAQFRRQLRAGA